MLEDAGNSGLFSIILYNTGMEQQRETITGEIQLSESLEEYIEAIYYICRRRDSARPSEVAEYLNVRRSSVTRALQQLGNAGMIVYTKYKRVCLTVPGLRYAEEILTKIRYAYAFLHFVLGLTSEKADEVALKIQRGISKEVLERIKLFLAHHARLNPHVHADCKHNKERCMFCQISDKKKLAHVH